MTTPATERAMRMASYASVAVAVALTAMKAVAWWWTGALAMAATLLDSSLDLFASVINAIAIAHALQPADKEHRFGHGKAESLAGLGQAILVGTSAFLLGKGAIERFHHPEPVTNSAVGIAVVVVSLVATWFLVRFQRRVASLSGSVAIAADSVHYQSDFLLNGGVLAALFLAGWLGWQRADPFFAFLVALWILWSAWGIARDAVDLLMDRELSSDERAEIIGVACTHAAVTGVHALRTRRSGPRRIIQFHIKLDGELTLSAAHEISDEVEELIRAALPGTDVTIHSDPDHLEPDEPVAML